MTICPQAERGTVIAVDATVRCARSCAGAVKAEATKTKKYSNLFRDRKATIFYLFALTVEQAKAAQQQGSSARTWRKIAASSSNGLNLTGAWRYIIARMAYGFAVGIGEQIVQYEHAVERASHTATKLHAHGFSGRRPQNVQMETI